MNNNEILTDEENYEQNEQEILEEELKEIQIGKLIKVQNRIDSKKNSKKIIDKKEIAEKINFLNKNKNKSEPKEFCAIIKVKRNKTTEKNQNFRTNKINRDPRFDNLSGNFNEKLFLNNFSFIKDDTKKYINKLNEIKKKNSKNKIKLTDSEYELIKKQINFVKGWNKNQQLNETKQSIETELKKENKIREKIGKNKIYFKKNLMKRIISEKQKEKQTEKEKNNFIKRKRHKEIIKTKKQETLSNF